jgi:RHS repeat-associated protein
VVSSYSYRYDANGNRLEQTEQNGFGEESTTYTYDRADRLTEVVYPDQHDTYTYDPAWNRVTETVADSQGTLLSSKVLGYNSRNQLTEITDSVDAANNATFGYDEIGNQVTKVKDGITTSYVYDARNHLREVTTGGSTVGQFLYDYRGLRTEKQGDRGTERYSYDDQSVLFQSDASNTPTAKYEYGPNRLLSLKQTGLASEFYLFDALRSPVTLVRKDGSISARYAYNAWGEKRHESGNSFNRFGFTGHEHDTETGLIYAKARYYDPDTARFLSQDPFAGIPDMPPSLHKYLYAYQNPTVFVDPDGMAVCKSIGLDGEVSFGNCANESQKIVSDPDGKEANARRASNEKTEAIRAMLEQETEGQRVRSVGANAACGSASAPANCIKPLPIPVADSVNTIAESESKPSSELPELQEHKAWKRKVLFWAIVMGATAEIAEMASPSGPGIRAAKGTGKAVRELAEEADNVVAPMVRREANEATDLAARQADDIAEQATKEAGDTTRRGALAFLNKSGRFYPDVPDLRTGRSISFPTGNIQRVPKADRVPWGAKERGAFIKEWYDRGYETPRGGWSEYDIHHIQPREFGGSNDFWNLTPLQRKTHQQEFNLFWRDM